MEPITRQEMFLAAASGEEVTLPEPITREEMYLKAIVDNGGGGQGTSNYNALTNKPKINGVEVQGNKTSNDYGIVTPTKTSDLQNDSNFIADANYVHTDNNYDATSKGIVDGVTSALAGKADNTQIQALTNEVKGHWSEGGRNILAIDPDYVLTIPTTSTNASNIATVTVEAGKTYTFSCQQDNSMSSNTRNTLQAVTNGQDFYESGFANFHLANGRHVLTFTAPATGNCILSIWGHTLSTQTTYSQFMLEEGSTATEYEPYAKTNVELTNVAGQIDGKYVLNEFKTFSVTGDGVKTINTLFNELYSAFSTYVNAQDTNTFFEVKGGAISGKVDFTPNRFNVHSKNNVSSILFDNIWGSNAQFVLVYGVISANSSCLRIILPYGADSSASDLGSTVQTNGGIVSIVAAVYKKIS